MPFKNKQEKLAYQRRWYAENKDRVMAAHRRYRHERCVGVCQNCGGPTYGDGPNHRIPLYCGKAACASAQRKGMGRSRAA